MIKANILNTQSSAYLHGVKNEITKETKKETKKETLLDECNHHFIKEKGFLTCDKCGIVKGRILESNEPRFFNNKEKVARQHHERKLKQYGARTIFNPREGKHVRESLMRRLHRINVSFTKSNERNYHITRPMLKRFAFVYHIPDYIVSDARTIYLKSVEKKLTQGRSIEEVLFASFSLAYQLNQKPFFMEKICRKEEVDFKKVNRMKRTIFANCLQQKRLVPISIKKYMIFALNSLKTSHIVRKKAFKMFDILNHEKYNSNGKDPKGVAGALIYLAATKTSERLTQKQISNFLEITEVTLRTRVNEIRSVLRKYWKRRFTKNNDEM